MIYDTSEHIKALFMMIFGTIEHIGTLFYMMIFGTSEHIRI